MSGGTRNRKAIESPLQFEFAEIIAELEAAQSLSESFTSDETSHAIRMARTSLENIRAENSHSIRSWQFDVPFRTRASSGYNGGTSKPIYGEVRSIWQIRRGPHRGPKTVPPSYFTVEGIASTEVRLLRNGNEPELLAFWKIEVATMKAPGTHFHMQIKSDGQAAPFPTWLSVPRFPTLFITPADAIEFCIGELFGDEWISQLGTDSPHLQRWRKIHRRRLERLLNWQLSVLDNMQSPWAAIKLAKPSETLFTRN